MTEIVNEGQILVGTMVGWVIRCLFIFRGLKKTIFLKDDSLLSSLENEAIKYFHIYLFSVLSFMTQSKIVGQRSWERSSTISIRIVAVSWINTGMSVNLCLLSWGERSYSIIWTSCSSIWFSWGRGDRKEEGGGDERHVVALRRGFSREAVDCDPAVKTSPIDCICEYRRTPPEVKCGSPFFVNCWIPPPHQLRLFMIRGLFSV